MPEIFDNLPTDPREWHSRPKGSLIVQALSIYEMRRKVVKLVKEAIIMAMNGDLGLEEVDNYVKKWMKYEF